MPSSTKLFRTCLVSLALALPACHKERAAVTDTGDAGDAGNRIDAATAEEDVSPIAPPYVLVGDPLRVVEETNNCNVVAESDPPGIVSFVGGELVAPSFPTPIRSYYGRFRAIAKGKTTLRLKCSGGALVGAHAVTVLEAGEAEPFVAIDGGDLTDADVVRSLEQGRAGGVTCYAAELARNPHARGSARMTLKVDTHGVRSVPADAAIKLYGVSAAMGECVRDSLSKAASAAPPKKSPPSQYPEWWELSLRFEMAPKTDDAKACEHFGERVKACASYLRTSTYATARDHILARSKAVTSRDGRHALAIECAALTDDLERDCAEGMQKAGH